MITTTLALVIGTGLIYSGVRDTLARGRMVVRLDASTLGRMGARRRAFLATLRRELVRTNERLESLATRRTESPWYSHDLYTNQRARVLLERAWLEDKLYS
jgi:hypothetical protein